MPVFASCARIFARILMKSWLEVTYYLMNISFKFQKDPSFHWGDMGGWPSGWLENKLKLSFTKRKKKNFLELFKFGKSQWPYFTFYPFSAELWSFCDFVPWTWNWFPKKGPYLRNRVKKSDRTPVLCLQGTVHNDTNNDNLIITWC